MRLMDLLRHKRKEVEAQIPADLDILEATIPQAMAVGRLQGINDATEVLVPAGPWIQAHHVEALSSTLLANARGALERSRHEAYPKTASEVEGYARGLQEAGERLQALLTELRGGQ